MKWLNPKYVWFRMTWKSLPWLGQQARRIVHVFGRHYIVQPGSSCGLKHPYCKICYKNFPLPPVGRETELLLVELRAIRAALESRHEAKDAVDSTRAPV